MANPLNTGNLVGRVSQDIKEFVNNDGSKTLLITLAVDNNFVSGAEQKAKTNYIPVRAFLPKTVSGRGSWGRVSNGDLIAIQTRIVCESYVKDGEVVYPAPSVEVDGFPQFLESQAITAARSARKAVAAPAVPAEETAEQTIARLTAQIADQAAPVANYDETSPFVNA